MFYNIVHQSTLPSGIINNALIIFSFRSEAPLNKSVEKFSKSLLYDNSFPYYNDCYLFIFFFYVDIF